MIPNPKPQRRTPEECRAERKGREPNPLKPVFAKKEKPAGLRTGSPLKRRTPLGVGKDTLKRSKPALARPGKRQRQKFWVTTTGAGWAAKKRKPLRLFSLSENAKERRRQDAVWRGHIWNVWGSCIIAGEGRPGHAQAHHCYDKSYRPEWRHQLWNGILLEARTIHPLADTYPEFHEALIAVADECRAAAEGRRPPVSRAEAREVIFRMAPKVRKYATPEMED